MEKYTQTIEQTLEKPSQNPAVKRNILKSALEEYEKMATTKSEDIKEQQLTRYSLLNAVNLALEHDTQRVEPFKKEFEKLQKLDEKNELHSEFKSKIIDFSEDDPSKKINVPADEKIKEFLKELDQKNYQLSKIAREELEKMERESEFYKKIAKNDNLEKAVDYFIKFSESTTKIIEKRNGDIEIPTNTRIDSERMEFHYPKAIKKLVEQVKLQQKLENNKSHKKSNNKGIGTMKKTILSIATASALMFSSVNASGIPTFDGANIAQAIMDYMQQLKDYEEQIRQYEQMVKDTLNFEKQMKEFGVDMTDINEILGEATQMISSMKNIYNDIKNIPEDIMGNVGRVKDACNFLEQHSEFFSIELSKINDSIQGKANRCMYALRNGMNVSKTIDGLTKDMHKIIDPIERANLQAQINNIKTAEMFLQERDNINKVDQLLQFENTFYNGDKTKETSKARMRSEIKELANQASKANNQKQAQALTNSILLKILENLQYQYELNINYTSTVASNKEAYSKASNLKNLTQESFNQQVVEYKRNDDLFQPETKQLPKDELGLPKFIFFKK